MMLWKAISGVSSLRSLRLPAEASSSPSIVVAAFARVPAALVACCMRAEPSGARVRGQAGPRACACGRSGARRHVA